MNQETAAKLIEDNLTAIYGYAYSKLYDKSKAEDLSSEIIVEILSSVANLRSEKAFWGFVWKIAENTFRKYIRREELIKRVVFVEPENLISVSDSIVFDETEYEKCYQCSDGDNLAEKRIYRLRRELSLLSRLHRDICVSYYVYNKSCSSIAKEYNISVEMVKQHLFKARKLLKEGMKMERKFGEKSYNPGTLNISFWGNRNHYGKICDRKLPGAILLAAYHSPMTPGELSLELGVAMPYLEEEIEILEAAGLLLKKGKKFETNMVIITDEYETKFEEQTKEIYCEVANKVYDAINEQLPEIRKMEFQGNDYDENRLLFGLINIALTRGYEQAKYKSPIGQAPKLALGGEGWVYGYDNDGSHSHFKGITMRAGNDEGKSWFCAVNYKSVFEAGYLDHYNYRVMVDAMCAAMEEKTVDAQNERLPWLIENRFIISADDRLSANFPVFSEEVFAKLLDLLRPTYEVVADCMINISDMAEKLLAKTVPKDLKAQCSDIAKIHHRLAVAGFIMEALIENEKLIVPKEKTPVGVFGVRK